MTTYKRNMPFVALLTVTELGFKTSFSSVRNLQLGLPYINVGVNYTLPVFLARLPKTVTSFSDFPLSLFLSTGTKFNFLPY